MLVKSLAGLSALVGVLATIDFEAAGDGTSNILLDGVHVADSTDSGANHTAPPWQCDVRAWTRAPDLSPGVILPADARLAANGSACGDIVKWEVGMRLKERALIKMRAKGVEFPVKPIQPRWNESFYAMHEDDYNDILNSGMYYAPHQDPAEKEYDEAMEVYRVKLQNASLWLISGQERVVYDLIRGMELDSTASDLIDVTKAFAIHMQNTNFPPIERYSGWHSGEDDQMLITETLSEFYHQVTLSNGTILDLPSGKIGIVPANVPRKPSIGIRKSPIGEVTWPQTVAFAPTNRNITKADDLHLDHDIGLRTAPACDKYNAANFTLRIDTNVTQPTLGQNITFNLTLTRTGNGSEYPAWLEITHTSYANITWARQFVDGEAEYADVRNGGIDLEDQWRWGTPRSKLRMMPSMEILEEEKKETEKRLDCRENGVGCAFDGTWRGGRWAKYELWDEEKQPREEYSFGLEVILPARDLPSFEKTFESIRSSLVITLATYFVCDVPNVDPAVAIAAKSPELSKLDTEWDNYALPVRKSKRRNNALRGMEVRHTSLIPLDAMLSSDEANTIPFPTTGRLLENGRLVHYLDEGALAPVLSESVEDQIDFPSLNQAVHEETEEERKRSRWGPNVHVGRRDGWCHRANPCRMCYELNGGGGPKLASAMWQSKLANEQEAVRSRADGTETVAGGDHAKHAFVVQA